MADISNQGHNMDPAAGPPTKRGRYNQAYQQLSLPGPVPLPRTTRFTLNKMMPVIPPLRKYSIPHVKSLVLLINIIVCR